MSTRTEAPGRQPSPLNRQRLIIIGVAVVVVGAIVLDTHVVTIGSEEDARTAGFSPETFAEEQFPEIQAYVLERAVEAQKLAEEVAADQSAAADKYGVPAGIGAVIPVSFEGVAGEGKSGIYEVAVDGLPEDQVIRVQTGPAINGTEIRDATGEIQFGQFTNQIEYQNVGAALNNEMKEQVLAGVDNSALTGETVSVTGVFTLINPNNWLVTPVSFEVQ